MKLKSSETTINNLNKKCKKCVKKKFQLLVENASISNEILPEIDVSQFSYDKSKVIGKGSFGKVYLGQYYRLAVAVKKLKYTSSRALDDFKHEVQTLMYSFSLFFYN